MMRLLKVKMFCDTNCDQLCRDYEQWIETHCHDITIISVNTISKEHGNCRIIVTYTSK